MKTSNLASPVLALFAATLPAIALAQAPAKPEESWSWNAAINLWLPTITSTTQFEAPGGGNINSESDPDGYLSKLKFVLMGSLEARRGPWSMWADAVYLNMGELESKVTSITGPGGAVSIPINNNTNSDLKGFVATLAGGHSLYQAPQSSADVMLGLRFAKLKTRLEWELSGPTGALATSGNAEASKDFWDGVVGVRGKSDLGGNWDVRYYLDAGAGSSRFTWQALAGIGYRFAQAEAVVSWRHLSYELRSDRPISEISFSGPQVTFGWRF
jgi:hypothetical protein